MRFSNVCRTPCVFCLPFNRQIIQSEFSPTWSCVSLTRSTTSREWKLFRWWSYNTVHASGAVCDQTLAESSIYPPYTGAGESRAMSFHLQSLGNSSQPVAVLSPTFRRKVGKTVSTATNVRVSTDTHDVGLSTKCRFNVGPVSQPIAGSMPTNKKILSRR